MKDISQIMRQAQQMQAKINEAQKKLEAMEVEGSSGGGMVKLTITGKNALVSIAIDPSLMVADEREILEDLIKAAHDDARRKLDDAQNEQMKGLSGGLGILPGFKMRSNGPFNLPGLIGVASGWERHRRIARARGRRGADGDDGSRPKKAAMTARERVDALDPALPRDGQDCRAGTAPTIR
jgi:hypothetical protein